MSHAPAASRSGTVGWIVLGLSCYAGFLAATAPAAVLGWALAHATNHAITLENPRESFWHGRADALRWIDSHGRTHAFEQLRWQWIRARLAAGELALQMDVGGPKLRGKARITMQPDGIRASNAVFSMPASTLAAFRPSLSNAGLTGELTLRSDGFIIDDGYRGTASVDWLNAASALSSVRPLGDYRLVVIGTGARLQIRIDTISGALQLAASGVWSGEDRLSLEGTARSEPRHAAALKGLLEALGPERIAGVHQFRLKNGRGG